MGTSPADEARYAQIASLKLVRTLPKKLPSSWLL